MGLQFLSKVHCKKVAKHFARFHTFIKSDISQAKLTAFEEVLDNQIFEQTYWKKSEIWPRTALGKNWGHWADMGHWADIGDTGEAEIEDIAQY